MSIRCYAIIHVYIVYTTLKKDAFTLLENTTVQQTCSSKGVPVIVAVVVINVVAAVIAAVIAIVEAF